MQTDIVMARSLTFPVLLAVALGLGGCAREPQANVAAPATTTAASTKAPLLVNITHGRSDLHAVSMGLSLARTALEKGHRVTVFLNVDAPVFATKDLAADVRFADFPPVSEMVRDIVAKGGKVVVCGHCAAVLKLDPASMQAGVTLAQHGDWLDGIERGTVGFSY